MENTSGRGKETVVPEDIGRWNWGAFLLAPLWGLFNRTFRALLVFVPVVGFFWWFVVGYKANEWAWRHKPWHSYQDFKRVQRLWSVWGIGITLASIVIIAATLVWAYFEYEKVREEVINEAVARVSAHKEAAQMLGVPIAVGDLQGFAGDLKVEGGEGWGDFQMPVQGSKTGGRLTVKTVKEHGSWEFKQLELQVSGSGERIDLLRRTPPPPKPAPEPKPETVPPPPAAGGAPATVPATEVPAQVAQSAAAAGVTQPPVETAQPVEMPAVRERRAPPNVDARHCLTHEDNRIVARCAEAYR